MSSTVLPGRRRAIAVASAALVVAAPLLLAGPADAALVATVPLATAAEYSVLGASAVTNTGDSVLHESLGLAPGPSPITGFPPGLVVAPGTTNEINAASAQAQLDLTAAYLDAEGREIDATTTSDLADLTLQGGVYAGPSHSPLGLTGPLVLDGAGDPTTVFIFQTDSTLITGSGSTVTLINGAQECNVFWQVGSSATLGTGSVFAGNILALTSVTVTTGVTVHGRALARTGAVTLDDDVFLAPACETTPVATTTPTPTTTTPGGQSTDGTGDGGGSGDGSGTGTGAPGGPGSPGTPGGPDVPELSGPPKTGGAPPRDSGSLLYAGIGIAALGGGAMAGIRLAHRHLRSER